MIKHFAKLLILIFGGSIRCAGCGHRVSNKTIVSHCRARHPEMMAN